MKGTEIILGDLDVFYISYDEPAKEEHWANLMMKFPFAKRVDGVKGFEAHTKNVQDKVKLIDLLLLMAITLLMKVFLI